MGILKPVLIVAILSSAFLCNNAWATAPPPRVGATAELPKAANQPDAVKAPAKKPLKRRAVRQIIDGTPAASIPPPPIVPLLPPPRGVPPPVTPQILNCSSVACLDANGALYHGGVGTTLLGPQGRVCSNNGIAVQCF
ncbi:MAG: hypothetical protein V4484_09260 [Pseudomonadota bacterium]